MSRNNPRNLMSIDIPPILYEIKGYIKGKRGRGEKEKPWDLAECRPPFPL
jgi:hypothetical protein